jgi:hypothetical protein
MGINSQGSSQAHSVLSRIRDGMDVYDRENEHIGTVDEVHFGAATDTQLQRGTGPVTTTPADKPGGDSLIGAIVESINPSEVPQELEERLMSTGYIRLDSAGLFASDRYVTPDQIATFVDDKVYLSVKRDELIKRR